MIYHFSTKVSPSQVQNCNHLIVTVDGLGDENKNHTVCAFQRKFLETGVFSNLKKRTTIFMEVEHTKFSWDADFGLIRRCESKGDTESILDVAEMIKRSTLSSGRNQVVLFNPKYFKHWSNTNAFIRFLKLERKNMMQFIQINETVHTRTKTGYSGPWTDHGELTMTGKIWPKSMKCDTVDISTPNSETITSFTYSKPHNSSYPHWCMRLMEWNSSIIYCTPARRKS